MVAIKMANRMKLQASEDFYKSLFNNTFDGLTHCQMIFDDQGNPADFIFLEVNKNFEKLVGIKKIVGKKVTEIIPKINVTNPELLEVCNRVSLTKKPERFEMYVKSPEKWFFISVHSPKKNFFVAAFQDITNRKQIEKNLEDAKIAARNVLEDLSVEKLKVEMANVKDEAIFSSIGDGLVVTDDKGNIVRVNKTFERLLGWSAKEVTGKKMLNIIQKVDENGRIVPLNKRSLQRVLSGEIFSGKVSSITKTHSYICKDKSKLPIIGIATPIILNNKIVGAVQVFRDVTYEQEIDKAKTEFVSVASHQLRTPLTAINLFVEMLENEEIGKLNPEQKDYIKNIRQSTRRMIVLVNDLLNVSRIETGRLKIEPQPTRLDKFIQSIIDELRLVAEGHKCGIVFRKTIEKIPEILIDQILIRQVIHNLITNAIRYSFADNCDIRVKLEQKNDDYVISVKDSGIGIPKEVQPRIFQKFFRADNAQKKETEGSGLGLFTAKMIIEASGGKIWFESEQNKGTTFFVSLPITGVKAKKGEIGLISS